MRLIFATLLGSLLLAAHCAAAADAPAPDFARDSVPFLKKHCLECHSGKEPKAELTLEPYRDAAAVVRQRKVWNNVLKMLTAGEMPPKERPRPTVAEVEAFANHVRAVFDHADRNAKPHPGRVTMRRLNRVEYRNTVRDLIGVDFDPTEDFPSDDIGHGFDNIGDVLTLSPVLMERYLAAAETIMDRAITPNPPPPVKRHLSTRYSEPAGSEVEKKAMEGNYRRLASDGGDYLTTGPINTPYQWDADGEYKFTSRVYASGGEQKVRLAVLVMGEGLKEASSDAELDQLVGNVLKPAKILQTHEVSATKSDKTDKIEVTVPAMPGRHRMMIALVKPAEGQPPAKLWVEYLALEGPLDSRPASQRRLLAAKHDAPQAEQSREVLARFLRRAFRRPPTAAELDRSLKLADAAIAGGEKWEGAMQLAMQAALCSPKFLFRVELDDHRTAPEARALDEFQLASRLSYFLWASMPDDTLLDLAEKKQLAANLDREVQRMLADPRSGSLVRDFAMQWLQVKRIETISPDGQLFPSFNDPLRKAMLRETELFVESILREDRSILDLIDADYTFLNEQLARHYGIADTAGNLRDKKAEKPGGQPIQGPEFRRVSLQDRSRGGLLTQGSVLTVTSNPTRTSPVKRGRWVLEQILGAPPPPPPANVPELPADEKAITSGSLRQRMEVHRSNPACANCHAKMDPIGFALENFNAVGQFRAKDGAFDIDASGEFADGTKFQGPGDLKSIIKNRQEEFARCLAEKMLIYALGRGVEYYDRPTVEKIIKSLAAEDYKFSVLVREIVRSDAFRQRRGSGE